MANTMASVGKAPEIKKSDSAAKNQIADSIGRLSGWLERNDYRGYDTFACMGVFSAAFTCGLSEDFK